METFQDPYLRTVESGILGVLGAFKNGLLLDRIPGEFAGYMGEKIDFRRLNQHPNDIRALLRTGRLRDRVVISGNSAFAKIHPATQHLQQGQPRPVPSPNGVTTVRAKPATFGETSSSSGAAKSRQMFQPRVTSRSSSFARNNCGRRRKGQKFIESDDSNRNQYHHPKSDKRNMSRCQEVDISTENGNGNTSAWNNEDDWNIRSKSDKRNMSRYQEVDRTENGNGNTSAWNNEDDWNIRSDSGSAEKKFVSDLDKIEESLKQDLNVKGKESESDAKNGLDQLDGDTLINSGGESDESVGGSKLGSKVDELKEPTESMDLDSMPLKKRMNKYSFQLDGDTLINSGGESNESVGGTKVRSKVDELKEPTESMDSDSRPLKKRMNKYSVHLDGDTLINSGVESNESVGGTKVRPKVAELKEQTESTDSDSMPLKKRMNKYSFQLDGDTLINSGGESNESVGGTKVRSKVAELKEPTESTDSDSMPLKKRMNKYSFVCSDMGSLREGIGSNLEALIDDFPEGILVEDFKAEYVKRFKAEIDPNKYNCLNFEWFCVSLPGIFDWSELESGGILLKPAPVEPKLEIESGDGSKVDSALTKHQVLRFRTVFSVLTAVYLL